MKEHVIDRTGWGDGPWSEEPDREQWRTKAGLPGLIVRSVTGGNLCGYVAVPPGHPAHGKGYDDVDVEVHGGLTYASMCREDTPICHVPEPGEPADVYWLGFDCAHAWDIMPAMAARERAMGLPSIGDGSEHYWRMADVRAEVESLAEQLAGVTA